MVQFPQTAAAVADSPVLRCRLEAPLACDNPARMALAALHQVQPNGGYLRDYRHSLFGVMAEAQSGLPSCVAAAPARAGGQGVRHARP